MRIKLVAFDFDYVLIPGSALNFVSREMGREREGEEANRVFYESMSKAKTLREMGEAVEAGLRRKTEVVRGLSLSELKETCGKIELTRGARETLSELAEGGYKNVILSASLRPIVEAIVEAKELRVEKVVGSECEISGVIGECYFVLTPLRKAEALRRVLDEYAIGPEECVAVGDSLSERGIFELVGRERSIGFNVRPDVEPFVGHTIFRHGDKDRDLRKILDVIYGFERG
ncbi:MAG: HAD family hydrolase [Candidatus Bathyarchaeia archaeon]